MGMPVIKPSNITREQSVGDLIESIALEENSIAHILNAESEKINAIISQPAVTPQQIIAANRSVKNTVDAIISLETALQSKLNLFKCMICQ
ncbi:MAG: hypothetical protein RR324_08700 [Cellulosilyticaceae bacterium]|uniref:hypothetical protein n=1 Tax=Niameybacter sp. TaxID=2033640 RepID=UPI002FCCB236